MERFLLRNILPAVFIGITIAILIFFFNSADLALVFASFGSSAFVIYTSPTPESIRIRDVIPAYFLAAVSGYAASFLLPHFPLPIVAGIAVSAAAFLMIFFKKMHAPACGIGLAFVIFDLNLAALVTSLLGGLLLMIIARVLVLAAKEEPIIQKRLEGLFD
jgi:CBS-domain-containing membrane protein